jgi:hypothetical protein
MSSPGQNQEYFAELFRWLLRPVLKEHAIGADLMFMNAKQTFRGITRSVFARLRKKACKIGFPVAKPVGSAKKDGISIHWNYDPQLEVLEVQCSTPFWINSARVNEELRCEIEATIRSHRAA